MDPISTLPPSIALKIIKLSPDLDSLRRRLYASPTMSSLFNGLGAEITEAVLSATYSPLIQNFFRYSALIRSGSDVVSSKHVWDLFRGGSLYYTKSS